MYTAKNCRTRREKTWKKLILLHEEELWYSEHQSYLSFEKQKLKCRKINYRGVYHAWRRNTPTISISGGSAPLLFFRLGRFLFNKEFCPVFLHCLHTPWYKLDFLEWPCRTPNLIATSALRFGSRYSDKGIFPSLPFHSHPVSAAILVPVTNYATLLIMWNRSNWMASDNSLVFPFVKIN